MDFAESNPNGGRTMNKINLPFTSNSEGNFGANSEANLTIGADIDAESARIK